MGHDTLLDSSLCEIERLFQSPSRRMSLKTQDPMDIQTGRPYPLGAAWDGRGVNFAVFSRHATRVDLCLFDNAKDVTHAHRVLLPGHTDDLWHGYVPGLAPGQLYAFRASGPDEPHCGHRFNPRKLLLDPYAKAVGRDLEWHDALYGYSLVGDGPALVSDPCDSAPYAPLGVVVDPSFDWRQDRPPDISWSQTLIYELHVKGFTQRHPGIPESIRGTYLGLCSEPAIEHLKKLGVTAVELLPVHHHIDEHRLIRLGLKNYWGYNTLAFFAPNRRYASGPSPENVVREFKTMVRTLHAAGIEVLLDVVYNHTAETGETGPNLSLRGLDNAVYYRLDPHDPRRCVDYTDTGNSLDLTEPRVLQLVMDSLRYWVEEMHVDGFRFDLASSLARSPDAFNPHSAFLAAVRQDPVLSRVKLIAEPWDVGHGGYQVGAFPPGWSEWNDRFRDDVRRFWKGGLGLGALATRLSGSSDLYAPARRGTRASINFITAHDGFTLHDLVSYNAKHNESNHERNRDGHNANHSSNHGVEGPTGDEDIRQVREQQKRNLLTTMMLSLGVPMITAGDEIGRTQYGNNNAYCHDSELTWLDWDLDSRQQDLLRFVCRLSSLRRRHALLRRETFLEGKSPGPGKPKDVAWYLPSGRELEKSDWSRNDARCLGIWRAAPRDGSETEDIDLFLVLNGGGESVDFHLPSPMPGGCWELVLDTTGHRDDETSTQPQGVASRIPPLTVRVFRRSRSCPGRQAHSEETQVTTTTP